MWLFPAVVAGMIFLFSSQHAEESSHLSNIFVQILAVIVVILDDFIILRGQGYLSVDYLTVDLLSDEQKYVKKLEDYKNYDYKKEFKRSILYSIIPAVIMCVCLLYGRQWWAAAAKMSR